MQLLEFIPLYIKRVWGGRNLQSKLGRKLPQKDPIGESWEIVDHNDDQSIVKFGPLAGKTLHNLLEEFKSDLLGQRVWERINSDELPPKLKKRFPLFPSSVAP